MCNECVMLIYVFSKTLLPIKRKVTKEGASQKWLKQRDLHSLNKPLKQNTGLNCLQIEFNSCQYRKVKLVKLRSMSCEHYTQEANEFPHCSGSSVIPEEYRCFDEFAAVIEHDMSDNA